MPTVEIDGRKVFVPEGVDNPEKVARDTLKKRTTRPSTLGDVGRGIAAGLVGIPQGLGTLGTTLVDSIFDSDLTRDLNNYFERFKPETNSTAGHVAQYLTQFGVPGLGVAGLLSKTGKASQILGFGAIDAAVATDDVETLTDLMFDDVNDEEKLEKLRGSEAATARLLDRLGVFAETAAIVGTVPIALQGVAKGAAATTGALGTAVAPIAKAVAASRKGGYVDPETLLKEKDTGLFRKFQDYVSFKGGLRSDEVAQIKEANLQAEVALVNEVERGFSEIKRTANRIGSTGSLNKTQKQDLAKAIGDYYAPKVRISYQDQGQELYKNIAENQGKVSQAKNPTELAQAQKDLNKSLEDLKKVETKLQQDSLEKIKSFEDDALYKSAGIPEERQLSNLLTQQRSLIDLQTKQVGRTGFGDSLIPDELKDVVNFNQTRYANRAFKALDDPSFKIDPTQRKAAVAEIAKVVQVSEKDADFIFANLAKSDMHNLAFENPKATVDFLAGNIKTDILKGRKLDSLRETRKALGEVAGFLGKTPDEILNNTQLQAYNTARKLASLTGKVKTFRDIKTLNDNAQLYGTKPFLFKPEMFGEFGKTITPGNPFTDPRTNKQYQMFDEKAGDLAGLVVSKKFHDTLLDSQNTFASNLVNTLGDPYKGFLGIKSMAQYNKTVFSPTAQIRNPVGGGIMTFSAGNMGGANGSFVKSVASVFNRLGDKNSKRFQKETETLRREGLIEQKSSAFIGEIENLAKFANESNAVGRVTNSGVFKAARNNSFTKGAQKMYTGSDDAIRAFNFFKEKDDLFRALVKYGGSSVPVMASRNLLKYGTKDEVINKLAVIDPPLKQSYDKLVAQGKQTEADEMIGSSLNGIFRTTTGNQVAGSDLSRLAERFKANPIKKGDIDGFIQKAADDGLLSKDGAKNLIDFIDAEAAQLAKNQYQNYGRTGRVIKDLAKLPIGNFAAFPSEIFRTITNIGYRAARELASNNPELQRKGMKRAVSAFTATTAFPAGVTSLGLALTGSDREQLDAYRRSFAAPWDKTATLVPLATDENGRITQMVNFSYTNPYDYLSRPFARLIAEAEEGIQKEEDLIKTFVDASILPISEIVSPFTTPSIATKLAIEAYTGKTETGRPLYRASDSFGDKIAKGFVHNLEGIAPPVLPFRITTDPASDLPLGISTPVKDFPKAVFGSTGMLGDDKVRGYRGNTIDTAETLIQGFSGLKVIRPTVARNLRYKGFEANNIIRAASNEFNRVARSAGERDAEDFTKAFIESSEARYKGVRDLYLAIEDARQLGIDDISILKELKKAKVANAELVMRGIFKPADLQKDIIAEAYRGDYDKARNLLPVIDIGVAGQQLIQPLEGAFRRETVAPPITRVAQPGSAGSQILRQQELDKLVGGT
jgi:hypothetical protein|tara:strand:+ start:1409 stop:5587 length:4179 start_codon:yes stop_codon:yes gene_type:complete